MKKIILIIFAGLMIGTSACSGLFNNDEDIEIRLRNSSSFILDSLIINPGSGRAEFGKIAEKEQTEYRPFDFGYRNAFIELKVEGKTFTQQPIDYVGESKLKSGRYTLNIRIDTVAGRFAGLRTELVRD